MNLEAAEKFIIAELKTKLPDNLFYHGFHHTLDVTRAALSLASQEGIVDKESLEILKTASLYHDSGFINVYQNHEEEGCRIAKNVLPDFDYAVSQIEIICSLIMATRLPQSPQTHLERILCDADLDYLGRDDYDPIAHTLFLELMQRNLVISEDAWNNMQIQFLKSHSYWTESARKNRNEAKQIHLLALSGIS